MLTKLGYPSDARLLLINADDYGMCHATNVGIQQLLKEGTVSSATVMVPCSWSREAIQWAAANPQLDVGIHLTTTSEWEPYKWGPVTTNGDVSSLVTNEGHFYKDALSFENHANKEQVRLELTNQIEAAMAMGLDPTHLDNHMGSLYGLSTGRSFLDVVFELCVKYGLPFRLPRNLPADQVASPQHEGMLQQITQAADAHGIIILDYLHGLRFRSEQDETYEIYKQKMIALLRSLQAGISELILHPSLVTDELKAIHSHWEKRGWEMDIFRDPEIQALLKTENIQLIRWRDLRDLQRSLSSN